jgi:nucleoside-diphosphate-sugar epimerase
MRVFVAGATGVLGRRLVSGFTEGGHEVVGLTRDSAGDAAVRARGGEPTRGDVTDRESVVAAAEGAAVLVHAATAVPTERKPGEADWERNDRVRLEGARNLVAAAVETGADRLLLQSVVWVARQPDGSPFDETSEPHPDRSTRSALASERVVREAADEHGFDAVVLRGGWLYAADAAHTRDIAEGLRGGRLPVIGGGLLGRRDATLSLVHVDDAARAFLAAAEREVSGSAETFHVVDDEPVTYARFLRAFAERLDAPEPRRVPWWLARPFVGPNLVRLLTTSMPTANDRLREPLDWEPRYPTYREGLDAVVEAWAEGDEEPTVGVPA